jgi:hypothetical protein
MRQVAACAVNVCGPETGARAATVLVSVRAECINSDGRRRMCQPRVSQLRRTVQHAGLVALVRAALFLVSSHMMIPNISEADSGFGLETHLLVVPSAEANRTRVNSVAGLMFSLAEP